MSAERTPISYDEVARATMFTTPNDALTPEMAQVAFLRRNAIATERVANALEKLLFVAVATLSILGGAVIGRELAPLFAPKPALLQRGEP